MAGVRVDLQGMTQKPEILGQISLGGVLGVREKISEALDAAESLISDASPRVSALLEGSTDDIQVRGDLDRLGVLLGRLEENASGYLSDFQRDRLEKLMFEVAALAEQAGQAVVPGAPSASEADRFVGPLQDAVDEMEIAIVGLEAQDVPVHERDPDSVWESLALLGVLGIVAWALS